MAIPDNGDHPVRMRFVVAIIVLLLVLAGRWFYRDAMVPAANVPPQPVLMDGRTIYSATATSGLPSDIPRRNQPLPSQIATVRAPLPPLGTKVVDVLTALKGPADNGDTRAACRLGIELGRCYFTRGSLRNVNAAYDRRLRNLTDPAAIDALNAEFAPMKQNLAADTQLCAGVPDADIDEAWSYTLQAATGGSAAAASYFLLNPATHTVNRDESQVMQAWDAHKDQFIQMGIESGNVHVLWAAYFMAIEGFGGGDGSPRFPRDPYKAITYGTTLLPYLVPATWAAVSKAVTQTEGGMDAADVARAHADASELQSKYFASTGVVKDIGNVGTPEPENCAATN